jgi:hypothetical protein
MVVALVITALLYGDQSYRSDPADRQHRRQNLTRVALDANKRTVCSGCASLCRD